METVHCLTLTLTLTVTFIKPVNCDETCATDDGRSPKGSVEHISFLTLAAGIGRGCHEPPSKLCGKL